MLNLYWKSRDHTRNLIPKPYKSETEFETYIFKNQDLLGDVIILYRQIHTGSKQGIPDMIGVDQDSRICIIEMKNVEVGEEILPQVLGYALWAQTNPDSIKAIWLEAKDRPEDIEINWDALEIRIIVIAPSYRPIVTRFAEKIRYEIEFIQVRRFDYEDEEFVLVETLEAAAPQKTGVTKPKEEWTWEYYEKEHGTEATQIFRSIVEQIAEHCKEEGWELPYNLNKYYTGFKWGNKVIFDIGWKGTYAWAVEMKIPRETAKSFIGVNWEFKRYDDAFNNALFRLKPDGESDIEELIPLLKLAYKNVVKS